MSNVIFTGELDSKDREYSTAQIIDFYENGGYVKETESLLLKFGEQIRALPRTDSDIIILDVDETALDSYSFIKEMNFNFFFERWSEWMIAAAIPPNLPVLKFYQEMVKQGYQFLFLTGRLNTYAVNTQKNLRTTGYDNDEKLITRTSYEDGMDAWEFKSGARKKLTEQGYRILGNIGDQMSDVVGGYAAYHLRLPNLLYIV